MTRGLAERGRRRPAAWWAGCSPARTASMTWTCSATAGWAGCSPGSGRPRRWARSCARFTHGHVQQLDAVGAAAAGRAGRPGAGLLAAAPSGSRSSTSMTRSGRSTATPSRAPAYGYTGVRGLNAAAGHALDPTGGAGDRRGPGCAGATPPRPRGAGRLLAQAVTTARRRRGDRADHGPRWTRRTTAARSSAPRSGHRAWFSVTARMTPAVTAAIASIDEDAWTPIRYPQAVFDEASSVGHRRRGRRGAIHRVHLPPQGTSRCPAGWSCAGSNGCNRTAGDGSAGRAVRDLPATTPSSPTAPCPRSGRQRHRDHAIVEQVIAELKDGPLAHLPSGRYTANAAWALTHRIEQRPRPDRHHRPTPRPPPTDTLGMLRRLGAAVVDRDQPTPHRHALTTQPATAQPRTEVETPGRPAAYWRPHQHSRRPQPESATRNHPLGGPGLKPAPAVMNGQSPEQRYPGPPGRWPAARDRSRPSPGRIPGAGRASRRRRRYRAESRPA